MWFSNFPALPNWAFEKKGLTLLHSTCGYAYIMYCTLMNTKVSFIGSIKHLTWFFDQIILLTKLCSFNGKKQNASYFDTYTTACNPVWLTYSQNKHIWGYHITTLALFYVFLHVGMTHHRNPIRSMKYLWYAKKNIKSEKYFKWMVLGISAIF